MIAIILVHCSGDKDANSDTIDDNGYNDNNESRSLPGEAAKSPPTLNASALLILISQSPPHMSYSLNSSYTPQ